MAIQGPIPEVERRYASQQASAQDGNAADPAA